jgi:hypothetical protein
MTRIDLNRKEFSNNTSIFGGQRDWLYGGHDLRAWYLIYDERQKQCDRDGLAEAKTVIAALHRLNGIL